MQPNGKSLPAWLALAVTIISLAAAGWIRAGALEQRVAGLEAARAADEQEISRMRTAVQDWARAVEAKVAALDEERRHPRERGR